MLKRLGKAAAKVAGVAGADDRVKRLEAEKDLLELRYQLTHQALEELVRDVDASIAALPDGFKIGPTLQAAVDEAREVLAVLRGLDD